MIFFNRKEEVLDIQLTQFGKHLLSKGVLKPVYYAFFDDDILYDAEFGGITEHQNAIEDRIKETPRLKTQYLFHGVETEIHRSIQMQRVRAEQDDSLDRNEPEITLLQPEAEKHYASATPLGNSALGVQNASSFKINFLKGAYTGSVSYISSSALPTVRIPQLDVELLHKTKIINNRFSLGGFEDGTNIDVERDFLVLEVEETNGFRLNKNFDVEIYEVEDEIIDGEATGRELLLPLSFPPEEKDYFITENDILKIDRRPRGDLEASPDLDPTKVEYFFSVELDTEINPLVMCEIKPVDKTKGLFSKRMFECPPAGGTSGVNIYGAEEEYEDPCEE